MNTYIGCMTIGRIKHFALQLDTGYLIVRQAKQ